MTKDLLRWEDSPGLEHHCPKCQTPLNNPRAKNTCYQKHVEICPQYHQQFFKKGQSHTCLACRQSAKMHNERHREIATLLRQLSSLQEEPEINSITLTPKKFNCSTPTTPTPISSSRRNSAVAAQNSTRATPSLPTTTTTTTPAVPKLGKRERKKAKKRMKALKVGDALTASEIQHVETSLHPEPDADESTVPSTETSTTTMTTNNQLLSRRDSATSSSEITEENIAFCAHVSGRLNSTRQALQSRLLSSIASTTDISAEVDIAVVALGITETSASKSSGCFGTGKKEGEAVVGQIRNVVERDFLALEAEGRELRIRQAGWLRFVNRRVVALGEEDREKEMEKE